MLAADDDDVGGLGDLDADLSNSDQDEEVDTQQTPKKARSGRAQAVGQPSSNRGEDDSVAVGEPSSNRGEDDSVSDSPELQCVGCHIQIKSQCPVDNKKKGEGQ